MVSASYCPFMALRLDKINRLVFLCSQYCLFMPTTFRSVQMFDVEIERWNKNKFICLFWRIALEATASTTTTKTSVFQLINEIQIYFSTPSSYEIWCRISRISSKQIKATHSNIRKINRWWNSDISEMNQWEKAIDRHFVVDFNLKIHLFSKLLSLICSTQQRKSNRNELIVCRSCVVCLYIWSCVAMFLLLSHHFVRSVIWAEKILEGMARFGAEMLSKHKCAKLLFITKQTTRLHKKRFTGLNWKRNVRLEMLAKLISLWLHCEVILRPRSRTSQKKKWEHLPLSTSIFTLWRWSRYMS